MGKYRHVIWDWNGTLFDDVRLCVETINTTLARRGRPQITLEQYHEAFGFPIRDYYRRLALDALDEPFEAVAAEFVEAYERRKHECLLHEGAVEALEFCAERGYPQSILSAYEHNKLLALVEACGIAQYFTRLSGLEDDYGGKKTDVARRLLAELDATGRDVLLVGDTTHDFEVAQELGVDCALVAIGHHPRAKLEQCGVPVLDGLNAVPRIIEGAVAEQEVAAEGRENRGETTLF